MSFAVIGRIHRRQLLGGRRILAIGGFLALPVLLAAAVRLSGAFTDPEGRHLEPVQLFLFLLYPQVACILLALIDGALYLSNDLEGRTLTYLFTRPIPKRRIIGAKYVAGVAGMAPLVVASLTACHAIFSFAGGWRTWLALAVTSVAALAAYDAVFAAIGSWFHRRAMIVCLVYAMVVEFTLSFFPVVLNEITVGYGLRSLALAISGAEIPDEVRVMIGDPDLVGAAVHLVVVVAAALLLAGLVVTHREFAVVDDD